ncbi:TonB-dependent receptor [Paludibacter sp. 221]|uniref:TonB-dependent receptor n=1 Tax=Paludibacter sp. 221 TaxID=2302939 RepID=UPI0013D568E0|nr:TonB-dependent receptor [Paludibacter sp. 221]NDV47735.1 TonB-dependent receptor [Paludibacter sp. 221]
MRQFLITLAILLSSVAIFAQYTVKGTVLDENGNPMEGSSVVLEETAQGKTTAKDGTFVFENLDSESHTIHVLYLGYESVKRKVKAGESIQIGLQRKSFNLDEVTVTSLRATDRSAVAYSNVTAEELSQRNLGQDLPYLLSLTPSFVATSDAGTGIGYTGFRIRGTDANRINVTINGIPYNDAESQGSFLVNVPDLASSLSSVQVQRGVGTSTNGAAAFGASINMQTDHVSTEPYAEVSTSYGSFNTTKYTVKAGTGIMANRLAFDGRVSGINSDGYVDRAFSDLKSYMFSAGYYGDNTTLKFLSFGGKEKTYQAWNGVDLELVRLNPLEYKRTYNDIGRYVDDEGNVQFYDNQTDNYTQIHYQLHWMQKFTPHLYLNMALHYTDGEGYYEDYKTGRKYVEYGLTPATIGGVELKKTDLIRQKWLQSDFYGLVFSLNYNKEKLQASLGGGANRYACDHFGKVLWVRHPNGFDPDKDWYRGNSIKDDANIYAKANWEAFRNFFVTADLQFRYVKYRLKGEDDKYDEQNGTMRDITQTHNFPFFNPKVGVTYKPGRNQNIFASFSVANREPNRNNYTDAGENEKPTGERLYDTEVGYQFLSPRFGAGVNLYYMRYKDQLILTGKISDIGEPLTSNIPNSYRAGIELTAGWKISQLLRWDGNMTLSQNKILGFTERDVDIYDENGDWTGTRDNDLGTTDISYSPAIIANSIFTFNYRNFEAGLYSSYVGRQYIDNTSDKERSINPYFVNNVSVKYTLPFNKVLKGIDFQLLINNLFNAQYESNGYTWYSYYVGEQRYNELRHFPQAGTNFMTSVTLRF